MIRRPTTTMIAALISVLLGNTSLPFCATALSAQTLSATALATLATPGAPAQPIAAHSVTRLLRAGHVLAVPGEPMQGPATLVIGVDGRIAALHAGWPGATALGLPADTPEVDLKDRFVMPGFMDVHVHITSGVTDSSDTGTGQQFTDAELLAIAWAAHSMGRRVTTHAHGKEGIDAAVRAGYDSIEHAMWADEESLKAMKARGTWLVPTVWPIDWVGDTPDKVRAGPFRNLNPNSMAKMLQLGDQPKKLVRMAVRLGVNIALGTDSGISPHGTNGREMIEYVAAGMTPAQALKAGTVNAAAAMGLKDRGALQPGMLADVIALRGDPLADIAHVLDVDFVMRDGVIFKQSGQFTGE